MSRPKLWGIWLSNHTDIKDDEWIGVTAHTKKEAIQKAHYDSWRYSIATVLPAKEFCKQKDISRKWLSDQNKK